MKLLVLFFIFLTQSISYTEAENWAVVVAGSSGWYNYRHQADACHAYQVLRRHGVPAENIITLMYDDIARNSRNPTPGIIINKPNGTDVYKGVKIDYSGMDVTPENFLNVIQGNATAMKGIGSGRVLASRSTDDVFVYFTDHGAPNIIAFPYSELHAEDLIEAMKNMYKMEMYRKMVFYVEACESGSMFNRHKLPTNMNIFATTAANGAESSYACYYDKKRRTYLGDVYSIKWLEDSDTANFHTETLEDQFEKVKKETTTSHVEQFGDLTISKLPLGKFQGELALQHNETKPSKPVPIVDAVPSPDVKLWTLKHQLKDEDLSDEERKMVMDELEMEHTMRSLIRSTFYDIAKQFADIPKLMSQILTKPAHPTNTVCYRKAVTKMRKECGHIGEHEHTLRHIYVLANLCDEGFESKDLVSAIENACTVAASN